jgi:parallel beta-helix repeat protein
MNSRIVLLLLLLFSLLRSSAAAQTTIRVPADQPTIQAAISAAAPGDTVLVAPGTYIERINFLAKAVVVTSEDGPEATIIDGNAGGVVVTFNSGEGPGAVLHGFTITNGGGVFGGGVAVSNSSPTIGGNIITRNTGCDGIGINVSFGSPRIVDNQITNNVRSGCSGGVGGAGIKVAGASAPIIEANVISDNSLTGGDGGGISLFAAGSPVIRNNVIARNSVSGLFPAARGGGIRIVNQSDALIVQNVIVQNSAGEGGGIYWLVPSGARGPLVINNTIADNVATVAGRGSAVFADGFDAKAVLVNNVLVGAAGQTALYCGNFNDPNPPVVQHNDIFTPTGPAYGGICADQTGTNGNLSADPAFVSPGNGDYRLQFGAPVIDRGNSAAAGVPTTDLDGRSRILDGDGDGVAVVDMGAYETQAIQTVTVTQGAPATAGYGMAFTVSATGGGSGNPVVIEGSNACTGEGSNSASITMRSGTGTCTITLNQAGNTDYLAAQQVVQTTAAQKATPSITWTHPPTMIAGVPLSATELDATASVPGTFAYTPLAGTVLAAGPGQMLQVTFKPTDAGNYAPVTASTTIDVLTGLVMGPQAIEGDLRVRPGDTLMAGYDLSMPGSHPVATLLLGGSSTVTLQAQCVSASGGGSIVVRIPDQGYTIPQNNNKWFPSGDQESSLVYQGSTTVPDLCSGGQMTLKQGGTFTTGIRSSDRLDKVNVRWHYSANGSKGAWSGTKTIVPGP